MAFRSKYHFLHMKQMKDDSWLKAIRPQMCSWDSNNLDCSTSFVAMPCQGAGGCIGVYDLTRFRRVEVHYKISAHDEQITDCKFSPFNPNLLMTGSRDATLRLWNIPPGGLTQDMVKFDSVQVLGGHLRPVANIIWHPTCENVFVSGCKDRTVKIWDVEKGQCMIDIPMKNTRLNTPLHFSFNAIGNTFVLGCMDRKIYVCDPRSPDPFVGETAVFGSSRGMRNVYLPDKDLVVCTGLGRGRIRTIKLYDMKDLSKPIDQKELDQQSGVINMLFYDCDLGLIYTGGKGEKMIRYFDSQERNLHLVNTFHETNVVQRGLCFMHKLGLDTFDHEVGRFLKLTEHEVVPFQILYPRKSTVFQPDLFPDTNGMKPSGNAAGFFGGEEDCKPLEKISLEPGKRPEGFEVEQHHVVPRVPRKIPYEYWRKEDLIEKLIFVEGKLKEAEEKLGKIE